MAKRIRKSQKAVNFTHITCDQLVSTCAGWPNGKKNLCLLASKFELDQSQRKSMEVVVLKSTQVGGGQTRRKLNANFDMIVRVFHLRVGSLEGNLNLTNPTEVLTKNLVAFLAQVLRSPDLTHFNERLTKDESFTDTTW